MPMADQNTDFLQLKLGLHRKLFSFIRISRTEEEVIHFLVGALWVNFPDSRVCFSRLGLDGQMKIEFSRQSAGRQDLTGHVFDLNDAPEYQRQLRDRVTAVIEDFERHPHFPAEMAARVIAATGTFSRLDCPVGEVDGQVGILSFTYEHTHSWSPAEIELLEEMAELIWVFSREARAQNALKDSEAIFRQFAENIDAVFWMADPENTESIYVSPSYDHIWGIPREDLKVNARGFLDAILPEDRARVIESLKEHHRGPFEKFYRIRRPSGEIRWIKDRSFPVKNEDGKIYRVVGIAEDITPLREAQERLEATQAQVISNAKFAALGEMASGIAHEINNPLAVILGISSQLQERVAQTSNDAFVQSGLNTIDKMSRRIATIIKGLRTFSRQTDHDPMVSSDFLLIVQETLAIYESSLAASKAQLKLELPMDGLSILCRPSEISQVLLNLMNNARDAVSQSVKKNISIKLHKEGSWAYLTVEDTGPGVPAEIRERIFQPFFTTKDVGAGTGLGLSISKGIVEAHGGRLFLESAAEGARFVVKLPAEAK
jgi:PAS domain S-box-containing protein